MTRILVWLALSFCCVSQAFAQGTVINDSFLSPSLGQVQDVQVYLPEGYDPAGNYPVVYYLHGAFNGAFGDPYVPSILNDLISSGLIDPIVFVRPDGNAGSFGGSGWVNSGLYGDFEDYIVNDLTSYIESEYPGTSSLADARAIMGHSMGGTGAMHVALKHHDFYRVVASLSGLLDIVRFEDWVPLVNAENGGSLPYNYNPNVGLFSTFMFLASGAYSWNLLAPPYFVDFLLDGSTGEIDPSVLERWLAFDPSTLAESVPLTTDLRIFFDCGTNDEFGVYAFNLGFANKLNSSGLEYEFQSFDGTHTSHWIARIRNALQYIDAEFSAVASVEDHPRQPALSLEQNHPNPFNPRTLIEFWLKQDGYVKLEVIDLKGRRVQTLLHQEMHAGPHQIEWDAKIVPSGVYHYRLETASGLQVSKKLTVMK